MKFPGSKVFYITIILVVSYLSSSAQVFDFVSGIRKATIIYDKENAKLDSILASCLATDIELVTGYRPLIKDNLSDLSGDVIIIGNVSALQKSVIGKQLKLNIKETDWERYQLKVVSRLSKENRTSLLVVGSDPRGTAYGVFDISKRIGVSPWYWWADAAPKKQGSLSLEIKDFISNTPSVKYRGIFINDEDWGLQPWAAKTFEPETKDIGPKTYAKVFELLLRLRANMIWPAMHPSTRAFFHYPENKKVAQDYQIVLASSHAEPMLRNNVDEWDAKKLGPFNYLTNKDNVEKYWNERVEESRDNDAIYSMGMRGVHDGAMEGTKSDKESAKLLEDIIHNQREMLTKHINKDIKKVPQAFTAYKEVLDIYDKNLKLPDDITIVWPDDNYGYIKRLNSAAENKRSGGSGVYYHASYYGRPHDYLWIGNTNPNLMFEEMLKAYELNAKDIWVLNVGDIKPAEYNTQLFLDMAFSINSFDRQTSPKQHLEQWVSEIFGDEHKKDIAAILQENYQLAFERKPEFMGWSGVEPFTNIEMTKYNHFYYGDQAQQRIDAYHVLEKKVAKCYEELPDLLKPAFFELVYYPITGASLMNKKFLYRDKAILYAQQGRISSNFYAQQSQMAFSKIGRETRYFNDTLLNGKWKGIMSMNPRNLQVFEMPKIDLKIKDIKSNWAIALEGDKNAITPANKHEAAKILPVFNKFLQQKYFFDIFLTKNVAANYNIKTSEPWVILSEKEGVLNSEISGGEKRIWVSIDWDKIPKTNKREGNITVNIGSESINIQVVVNNGASPIPPNYEGAVESNGYLSFRASRFFKQTAVNNARWEEIFGKDKGRTVLQALPFLTPDTLISHFSQEEIISKPSLSYKFYTITETDTATANIFTLPTFALNKNVQLRYAVSIDNRPASIIDFTTFGRSEEWKKNVLGNSAIRSIEIPKLSAGEHTLHIFMIDPGVILDHILIDLGGLKDYYGNIPETITTK